MKSFGINRALAEIREQLDQRGSIASQLYTVRISTRGAGSALLDLVFTARVGQFHDRTVVAERVPGTELRHR